jgi:hypothetical protein
MEVAGGQFGPMPEANPTTEATANDVVQSSQASSSFQGHMADASVGNNSFWKQKQLEIIDLITSQEDASNQLSKGIHAFVERTSTMKKVCIPCSPRAPWRISIVNPSGCLMSTHASILVDSVGPPSAEVCRTAASFP